MDKICTKCNIEKPATLEFFYKHHSNTDGLTSWCKACMKALSKRQSYVPVDSRIPNEGEAKAIAWLKRFGIPANGGKNIEAVKWLDVLAWGCVRIEVKYSKTNAQGIWSWVMYSVNNKAQEAMPHLILLIGEDVRTGTTRYFLFDAQHPEFFNGNTGERKIQVSYNYQSVNAHNHEVFRRHENKAALVEDYRLQIARELAQK